MQSINKKFKLATLGMIVASATALFTGTAQAQAWPTKQSIKIVSPYAPGGTTDVLARMLGQHLQEKLKQTVVIENRAGAGGNIGTDIVAKSPADGYTLLLAASGPLVIAPSLYKKLAYEPMKDFTYISPVASANFVVVANAKSGLNTLADVISQGKQEGKLSYASAGSGTPQHIMGEMFNLQAGTKIQHIPYKGSGPAMNDLIGGQLPLSFENPVVAMPHVASGKLKVLAVTGGKRSASLPNVPTVAESGLGGFDARGWYALVGPANMPADITTKLNAAVEEFLAAGPTKQKLETLGAEPMHMQPAEFKTFVGAELDKWTKVVKTSGATVD